MAEHPWPKRHATSPPSLPAMTATHHSQLPTHVLRTIMLPQILRIKDIQLFGHYEVSESYRSIVYHSCDHTALICHHSFDWYTFSKTLALVNRLSTSIPQRAHTTVQPCLFSKIEFPSVWNLPTVVLRPKFFL